MRPLIFILIALSLIELSCTTTRTVYVRDTPDVYVGPPPWAPAHGHSRNMRYYYVPEISLYYDTYTGHYFYHDGFTWQRSSRLPAVYARYNFSTVYITQINYNGTTPYKQHSRHQRQYARYVTVSPRNNNARSAPQQRSTIHKRDDPRPERNTRRTTQTSTPSRRQTPAATTPNNRSNTTTSPSNNRSGRSNATPNSRSQQSVAPSNSRESSDNNKSVSPPQQNSRQGTTAPANNNSSERNNSRSNSSTAPSNRSSGQSTAPNNNSRESSGSKSTASPAQQKKDSRSTTERSNSQRSNTNSQPSRRGGN